MQAITFSLTARDRSIQEGGLFQKCSWPIQKGGQFKRAILLRAYGDKEALKNSFQNEHRQKYRCLRILDFVPWVYNI